MNESHFFIFLFISTDDIDISDIANYPAVITTDFRLQVVRKEPIQIKIAFPKTDGRSFSTSYYSKRMPNDELVNRDWLVYSQKLDAIFCFCCRIFGSNTVDVGINSSKGFRDWAHSTRSIKLHEHSSSHSENYIKWKTLLNDFVHEKTIENQLSNELVKETRRLRDVFRRLIAIILYLARQNIAFTGASSNLYDPEGKNGNFQQLVHTFAEFDPVLKNHLEKHERVHYTSARIQNELISVIGKKIQNQILENVKRSKYYAIILDGTTDITHIEQMCIVLRYVQLDEEKQQWEIKESFVKFADISSSKTGLLITEAAVSELKSLGLDLNNIRGQGFDNGAPMSGKNVGVQKRILDLNPRAFFNPCDCHTLNLSVNDSADSCVCATEFFAIVQKIFVFLSASTNRWDVLKKQLEPTKAKTPKPLCETRWSSRINAMKPLYTNPGEIISALKEIGDNESEMFNRNVQLEARIIAQKIDFAFICSTCLWYDILSQVDQASKALQSIQCNVETAALALESVEEFLTSYKEYGCQKVLNEAREICERISIDSNFDEQRRPASGRITITNEDEFGTNVFLPIVDAALNSIKDRFNALKKHNELFGFLYDFKNYEASRIDGSLLESCKKLEAALTYEGNSDIDANELFTELAIVSTLVKKEKVVHVIDILNAIQSRNMANLVPNAVIALRILLTIPVAVASGERSFSKLKLIKTYLRNAMQQNRLNDLTIISIEKEIANSLNYDDIIDEFATSKARKKTLI